MFAGVLSLRLRRFANGIRFPNSARVSFPAEDDGASRGLERVRPLCPIPSKGTGAPDEDSKTVYRFYQPHFRFGILNFLLRCCDFLTIFFPHTQQRWLPWSEQQPCFFSATRAGRSSRKAATSIR